MSFPHHNEDMQEQSRLLDLLRKQKEGTAERQWPEGRVDGTDDGQVAFKIESDPDTQVVKIDFGKPVVWVGMGPQDAVQMAQLLIKHARAISKEPIRIQLN